MPLGLESFDRREYGSGPFDLVVAMSDTCPVRISALPELGRISSCGGKRRVISPKAVSGQSRRRHCTAMWIAACGREARCHIPVTRHHGRNAVRVAVTGSLLCL
jgi:hypothetical protein